MAVLLGLCVFPWPYGYFMFVRIVGMIIFALLAYYHGEKDEEGLAIFYGALVVLFQPFWMIGLGRGLWLVVDLAVAIFLVCRVFGAKWK
jgi:hypothetical protein